MRAEILSIGSELTNGQNLDTNSQWLSQRLAEIGIPVGWHTTIADDLLINIEAFRIATRRATLVLCSGGLGPTQDDLTREVVAEIAGVKLMLHEESLARIQEMFARRKRTMPDNNRVQAMFPVGSEVIPNDRGTAPGIWMKIGDCYLAAMPGVPSELKAMYETQVKPRLLALGMSGGVLLQRKINTFGMGESQIEEKVLDLTRRDHVPEVGITASDATISLRIFARAADPDAARLQAEPIEKTIRERLGTLVFGVDAEELQHVVMGELTAKRKTLSVAEGVTGGRMGQRLAEVPGASACFRGGLIAYDNALKVQMLKVPQGLIDAHGAVSAPVAEAMAVGCRAMFNTDYAISTVGLAGPGGAMADKPVGMCFAAVAFDGGVVSAASNWLATRSEVQSRAAKMALNLVRLQLGKA